MGLPFSRATNYYSTEAEATATKRLLKEQQIMPMDVHKAELGTVYVCIPVGWCASLAAIGSAETVCTLFSRSSNSRCFTTSLDSLHNALFALAHKKNNNDGTNHNGHNVLIYRCFVLGSFPFHEREKALSTLFSSTRSSAAGLVIEYIGRHTSQHFGLNF